MTRNTDSKARGSVPLLELCKLTCCPHGASWSAPQPSFIPESSFMDAPLNSRVNTSASPRKQAPTRSAAALRKELANGGAAAAAVTSTRLRQIISNNDSVHDDEADIQTYDDRQQIQGEQDGETEYRETPPAEDLLVQEALLVEDLLCVLRVRVEYAHAELRCTLIVI